MSEQNILNPTVTSALNPDYAVKVTDPAIISRWQARSGKPFMRRLMARGPVYEMTWGKRMLADYLALQQWFYQYENDFFSFIDWDRGGRYYSGMFADQPQIQREANNQITITAQFVVVPGLNMFQFPSNWAQDAIFVEERNGFGADLVKLTTAANPWNHGDVNFLLQSQDFELAPWFHGNATITPDSVTDPLGGTTADSVTFSSTDGNAFLLQALPFGTVPIAGQQFTFSVSLKAASGAPTIQIGFQDQNFGGTQIVKSLSTNWVRYSVTEIVGPSVTLFRPIIFVPSSTSIAYHLWGAQLEYGAAATPYAATTSSMVPLASPSGNANFHGNFAYSNPGTNVNDAAEWSYFGYGFQLYSCKGPDMGVARVYLDGVLLGTVDLYAAASTPSAPVFTVQNVPLGFHRVKLTPNNTKNAASSGFCVTADAIQVMR